MLWEIFEIFSWAIVDPIILSYSEDEGFWFVDKRLFSTIVFLKSLICLSIDCAKVGLEILSLGLSGDFIELLIEGVVLLLFDLGLDESTTALVAAAPVVAT